MTVVNFFRSTRGRVFGVLVGFALIMHGATQVSLAGLILMMVGVVPIVTGLAGICLPGEVGSTREGTRAMPGRTGEGHV